MGRSGVLERLGRPAGPLYLSASPNYFLHPYVKLHRAVRQSGTERFVPGCGSVIRSRCNEHFAPPPPRCNLYTPCEKKGCDVTWHEVGWREVGSGVGAAAAVSSASAAHGRDNGGGRGTG